MMRYLLLAAFALLNGPWAGTALAAETTYRLPSDSAFLLELNLQAVRNSEVGGKILDLAMEKAVEKLAQKGNTSREEALRQVEQIVGFNPLEEVKTLAVSAADYEKPETSLIAVVQLGKTTGNLEGLLLGLPEYQVTEYEGQQIHSAAPDAGQTLYVAFVTDEAGNRRILFSPKREAVTGLIDQAAGKAASSEASRDFVIEQAEDRLLSLKTVKLPEDFQEEGPPANIAKILKDATMNIDEADGRMAIEFALVAGNEQQAEQLRQMAQGFVAMIEFAKTANPDDDKLQKISGLVNDAVTSRDGATVKVGLQIPAAEVTALLEEKLKNK